MATATKGKKDKKAKKNPKVKARGKHWVITFLWPTWYRPKPKLRVRPTLHQLLRTKFQARPVTFVSPDVKAWKLEAPMTKEGRLALQVAIPHRKLRKQPAGFGDPRNIFFSPWRRSEFQKLVAVCKERGGWPTK